LTASGVTPNYGKNESRFSRSVMDEVVFFSTPMDVRRRTKLIPSHRNAQYLKLGIFDLAQK
jgi:hypothetical protein